MVVTSRPSHCAASIRHDTMRLPSSRTVQAPHAPWSQPFLVPVRPRWSRSASSRVTWLSSCTKDTEPLTVSFTVNGSVSLVQLDIQVRSEEHTSELQSHFNLACRL